MSMQRHVFLFYTNTRMTQVRGPLFPGPQAISSGVTSPKHQMLWAPSLHITRVMRGGPEMMGSGAQGLSENITYPEAPIY